jgi:uncharacterized protein (TIGR02996 family)
MIERAREALEEYRAADAVFQLLEIFHPNAAGGDYAAAFDLMQQIRSLYALREPLIPAELEARVRASPVRADTTAIWRELQAKIYSGAVPNGPPPEPEPVENAPLLRAIDASPSDPAPYLVYADWLQQQGDPRGQLIILDHALLERPEAGELLRELTHLLNRYPSLMPERAFHASRFCGFVRSLALTAGSAEEIRTALLHPSSRFLRELSLELFATHRVGGEELIAAMRLASPHLSSLTLRSARMLGEQTGVGRLVEALPALRHLKIRHGGWSLADLGPSELSTLELFDVDLSTVSAELVLPRLRSLIVSSYRQRFEAIEHVLFKRNFPALRHLGLCDLRMPKASCRALARSDLVPQLESLDLSGSTLRDAGLRELLASRALAHLSQLDLSRTEVTPAALEAARSALRAEITRS